MVSSRGGVRLGHPPFRTFTAGTVAGAGLLLSLAGLLAWVALRLILIPPLAARQIDVWDEVVWAVAFSALLLLLSWAFGYWAYRVLESIRGARWLAGTRLGQRRVLRTVWVDLSGDEIETDEEVEGPNRYRRTESRQQWLVARAATGVTVKLLVSRDGQTLLPAAQLTAVADAIVRDRPRWGSYDDRAYAVAERLRRLAADPDTDLHGRDTAGYSARYEVSPVFLLVVGLLFIGLSGSGIRSAVQETQVWLDYRPGQECRSSTDTSGCWTQSEAMVIDVDFCRSSSRYSYCAVKTRYDLRLADRGAAGAELGHVVEEGPAEGDTMDVRVFRDRVVSLHDGTRWVDTRAHPRVALARSVGFAGVLTGTSLGALIGAVAIGGVRGGRWRRRNRYRLGPRHRWGWIGAVVFWAPVPAFFIGVWWPGPPVWVLLLLTAGTTAAGIIVHFRRRSRRVDPATPPAGDTEASDASNEPADAAPVGGRTGSAGTSGLRYAVTVLTIAVPCVGGTVVLGVMSDRTVSGLIFAGLLAGGFVRLFGQGLRKRGLRS